MLLVRLPKVDNSSIIRAWVCSFYILKQCDHIEFGVHVHCFLNIMQSRILSCNEGEVEYAFLKLLILSESISKPL